MCVYMYTKANLCDILYGIKREEQAGFLSNFSRCNYEYSCFTNLPGSPGFALRMLPANMEKMISKRRNQQPELHNQLRFQLLPQPWQRQRQHLHRCMHQHRRLSLLQHQLQWYNQRPVESLHDDRCAGKLVSGGESQAKGGNVHTCTCVFWQKARQQRTVNTKVCSLTQIILPSSPIDTYISHIHAKIHRYMERNFTIPGSQDVSSDYGEDEFEDEDPAAAVAAAAPAFAPPATPQQPPEPAKQAMVAQPKDSRMSPLFDVILHLVWQFPGLL